MNSIDSYFFSPRCDKRTGVCLTLGTLAAGITAVAFTILCRLDYISLTNAYITAAASGSFLFVLGGALASIRSQPPIVPEQIPIIAPELLEPTQEEVESFLQGADPLELRENSYTLYPPDKQHPFAYRTINLHLNIAGKKTFLMKNVTFQYLKREKEYVHQIKLTYQGKEYTKQVRSLNHRLATTLDLFYEKIDAFEKLNAAFIGFQIHNCYLPKKSIRILEKEGYDAATFIDIEMFDEDDHEEDVSLRTSLFIPGVKAGCVEGQSVLFTREEKCPDFWARSLKDHPHLIDKLANPTWKLDLPPKATSIKVKIIDDERAYVYYDLPEG